MSHGGKTWWIEIIIFVICSVILIALFEISRNLFNYLRFTFAASVDYRTAFALAILDSTISSMDLLLSCKTLVKVRGVAEHLQICLLLVDRHIIYNIVFYR